MPRSAPSERSSRPAPASSMMASAHCTTRRTDRVRAAACELDMPRPLSRSASCRFTRDSRHAGHSPNNSAVTVVRAMAKTSDGAVEAISSMRGRSGGASHRIARTPAYAASTPAAPADAASALASIRSCQIRLLRLAPMADAHHDLAAAGLGAREEESGDVHARDQQHESDRAKQNEQRRLDVAGDVILERIHVDPVALVVGRDTAARAACRRCPSRSEPGPA